MSWVELKVNDVPPVRATTPLLGLAHGLSPEQRNWHMDWRRHGGTSFIMIGTGIGATARQFLLPGFLHDDVNDMPLTEIVANALATAWCEIFDCLRGKTAR